MKIFLMMAALLATTTAHAGGSIVSGGFDDLGIEVKFYSPGNGIDIVAEKKLLEISVQGLKHRTIVKIISNPEGFEGDITYCIQFKNSGARDELFQAFDDLVRDGKNVSGQTIPYCGAN